MAELYKQYNGAVVRVLGKAVQTDTGDNLVLYVHNDGEPGVHAQPERIFWGDVEFNGQRHKRFTELATA